MRDIRCVYSVPTNVAQPDGHVRTAGETHRDDGGDRLLVNPSLGSELVLVESLGEPEANLVLGGLDAGGKSGQNCHQKSVNCQTSRNEGKAKSRVATVYDIT